MRNDMRSDQMSIFKRRKKIIITVIIVAILIAALTTGYLIFVTFFKPSNEDLRTLTASIRNDPQLVTVSYDYHEMEEFKDYRSIMGFDVPLTKKYFVYKVVGTIKYGFELDEIKPIKFGKDSKTLEVKVPEVKLISNEMHLDNNIYRGEKNNLLNSFKPEDIKTILKISKEKAEKKAIKNGIIKKTQESFEQAINNLKDKNKKLKRYTIKFSYDNPNQKKVKRADGYEG